MVRYTHAIVCRLPNNVQLDTSNSNAKIDLQRARQEHEEFVDSLRQAGVDVAELVPEESAPAASLFVEDCAVVCNGTALITRPSHVSRRKEIAALLMELGLYVIDLDSESNNKKILLEGSDVLFTGREFFVGITKKTNVAGAMEVAKAFPEYPVTPVKVNGPCHLKQYVCLAAPNVLAVGSSKEAQNILKRVEREATFRYQTLTLNDDAGVNCVNVNGTLFFRPDFHACVEKFGTLQDVKLCPISIGELSKLGGMLSQNCVLFRRFKLLKNI